MPETKLKEKTGKCERCSTPLYPDERHISIEACVAAIGERVSKIESQQPSQQPAPPPG